MAELFLKSGKGGAKMAPRIDLTPMVDLGFLVITFFMLTTTMNKPNAMEIQMPSKQATNDPTVWYESSAITLLPAADHRIYYYEGVFSPDKDLKTAKDMDAVRKVLQQKQSTLKKRPNAAERDLQVLMKPDAHATFSDIVGLFDEMDLLAVKHYAMVDISKEEAALIRQTIERQ